MCYMSEPGRLLARVGVRELRQNLSVYLDRVKEGESLEVTEHGRPVARLVPNPPPQMSRLQHLIAEGRATPAKGDLLDIQPIRLPPGAPLASDILSEMRDEERW
jgi:prevent-host-death family protein